jgi:hypothetical protein
LAEGRRDPRLFSEDFKLQKTGNTWEKSGEHGNPWFGIWDNDITWLVVWNMNFIFFHILGIMNPTDELICFKMVETTKQ